jgi:hypothetical protein
VHIGSGYQWLSATLLLMLGLTALVAAEPSLSPPAQVPLPPPPPPPPVLQKAFASGERLVYSVTYMGLRGGTVTMEVQDAPPVNGRAA